MVEGVRSCCWRSTPHGSTRRSWPRRSASHGRRPRTRAVSNSPSVRSCCRSRSTIPRRTRPWPATSAACVRMRRGAPTTWSSSGGSTICRRATRSSTSCPPRRISSWGSGTCIWSAPVAVPLDPRHRLVTTKYDPARTWTPENAVGTGGVYLCVYGMEGPGGYQLVGRTVPVWRLTGPRDEFPWQLRLFDRLRFRPVPR
ncbi:carboxyltransferase domain-containing protein [Yinghuangia aomiensis]